VILQVEFAVSQTTKIETLETQLPRVAGKPGLALKKCKKMVARESICGVYIVHSLAFPPAGLSSAGQNTCQIRMNPRIEVVL
jgi:hypothetical protein